jgi:hypothetical protein
MSNLERIIKLEDLEINKYYYYSEKGKSQIFQGKFTKRCKKGKWAIDGKGVTNKTLYTFYTKSLGKTKETILSELNLRSIHSSCLQNGIKYYYHDHGEYDDYDNNNNFLIREGIITISSSYTYYNPDPYSNSGHYVMNKNLYFIHTSTEPVPVIINPGSMIFYTKNNTPKNEMEKELDRCLKKREVFSSLPPL